MRFLIEAEIAGSSFEYTLALELPDGFKEMRVLEEKLSVNGTPAYAREISQVKLAAPARKKLNTLKEMADQKMQEPKLLIDWHLVALPIIQQKSPNDPIPVFRQWLSRTICLRPVPPLITGDSEGETLEPQPAAGNFGAWFSAVIASTPAAYTKIDEYLKQVLPDFQDLQNPVVGKDSKSLVARFENETSSVGIPFQDLSDGEKCFMICALLLAANRAYGPLVCFWDEPDNYLALDEVGHFVMTLRREFQKNGGQFIATSHNPEAIRRFSDENTLVLQRRNHLEPTTVRKLAELQVHGDLIGALIRGDLNEPVHGRQSS